MLFLIYAGEDEIVVKNGLVILDSVMRVWAGCYRSFAGRRIICDELQLVDPWTQNSVAFIPFIENAFKHTENKNLENAINIKITINKERIIFECENKFTINSQNKSEHNGLGNGLIEKRLLLLYPNKHQLNITKENNTYKVS